MPRPYFETKVPIQSVLKITVTSAAQGRLFTSSGELESPAGPTRFFADAELANGARVKLGNAGPYPGFIDVVFAKPTKATVTIELLDPQGNVMRTTSVQTVNGGAGKIRTIYLLVEV
jgi:hypothetical protein